MMHRSSWWRIWSLHICMFGNTASILAWRHKRKPQKQSNLSLILAGLEKFIVCRERLCYNHVTTPFQQEWCLKVTAYDQDKYSNATELCDVNLPLKDVKNLTTAKEGLSISCNLTRTNRVSRALLSRDRNDYRRSLVW
jgi:hypothetical protein